MKTFIRVIAEIPETKPTIDGIVARYRPGDELRGNCSSEFSKPAANLTWTVNDAEVCIHQCASSFSFCE